MLTFESLPVELISDILGETDIQSLIVVSGLSRRLREIISDPALNPWRRPILRRLHLGEYGTDFANLSLRMIVPKYNWIQIMSKAHPEFLLFEATAPNLNEHEWDECFRRRFLPSWVYWKKSSSWRTAFYKTEISLCMVSFSVLGFRVLYRIWHRTHSPCTADEAWTRYLTLNRNGTASQVECTSRNFNPVAMFNELKHQNNLLQFETAIRVVVQFADVRVLAFGVRNTPKTSFSVNDNAWLLLHPPKVRLPNEIEEVPTEEPDMIEDEVEDPTVPDPTAPGRLRYPTPALGHRKYPMYTPGGLDRRWINEFELEHSHVKWVGNMMLVAQLVGPHTMEPWSRSPQLQDSDLVVGPGRNQYASLCWEDLSAIAPWLDEQISKKLEGVGLGH
ncbi:hypothetical protein BDM02DRAFT_3163826 [Thelephora ganbajun]|uniref:Uncharacterized protein n=1 Tax=Thelephora ganbajun TaxID=370292 RepID=A0ACB6ZMP8_THEGA|nr:hypothetical protein BDM02DRAFT_3163826 [Thelephora ganbajun]